MANATAALKVQFSFASPDQSATLAPSFSVSCPFQAQNSGTLDVPDLESSATAHAIPFGSIAQAALIVVRNRSGQECIVKVNGSLALYNVPDGGLVVLGSATLPASTPLASFSLTTTGAQAGAGYIDYWVFGDSV